jgi:hypothetical protein
MPIGHLVDELLASDPLAYLGDGSDAPDIRA